MIYYLTRIENVKDAIDFMIHINITSERQLIHALGIENYKNLYNSTIEEAIDIIDSIKKI